MPVRKLALKDLGEVSAICKTAFMATVAPTLEQEGIDTFRSIASKESIKGRMNGENDMLVFEEKGCIAGFLELKAGHHIAMLFVSPDWQRKGVGKALIYAITPYAKQDTITVSASLTSVLAYQGYGFCITGDVSKTAGLVYQPMEISLTQLNSGN